MIEPIYVIISSGDDKFDKNNDSDVGNNGGSYWLFILSY